MSDLLEGTFEICPRCKTRVPLTSKPELNIHLYGKCETCGLYYLMLEGKRRIKFE